MAANGFRDHFLDETLLLEWNWGKGNDERNITGLKNE